MRRVSVALLALALVALASPPRAEATIFRRPAVRPYRPAYGPGRMPGWDWWRIDPYSPYNYGRNPYNPIVVPYPYPYPYVVPQPYPVYGQPYPTYVPSVPVPAVPPVPPVPAVPTLGSSTSPRR